MDPVTLALGAWKAISGSVGAILNWIWAILSGWPLKAYVCCAIFVSAAFWWSGQRGWDRGVSYVHAQDTALRQQADASGSGFKANVVALDAKVNLDLTANLGRIDLTYGSIDKEIASHVTPAIDKRYPLSCGFVRLHDASILGVDPARLAAPGCAADDAAAPTPASLISRSDAERGRYERELEAQNAALRAEITGYLAAYNDWRTKLVAINGGH